MSPAFHVRAVLARAAGVATLAAVLVYALPLRALADGYVEGKNRIGYANAYGIDRGRTLGEWLVDFWFVPAILAGLVFIYLAFLRPRWRRQREAARREEAQPRAGAVGEVFGEKGQRGGE